MDGLGLAAAINPLTTLDLVEDFVGGTFTSGTVGTHGWGFAGGTISGVAASASHPGIIRRDTSATVGTIAYTRLQTAAAIGLLLASEIFDTTWVFRLNQSDADTKTRFGFSSDFTVDAPASSIYLEKQYADTSFFGTVRIASVETRTAALGVSDTNWHKVRIRRLDASNVGFTLDASAEVSIACNLATNVNPGSQITNQVAASKTMDLDYFRLRITGLSR